MTQNPVSASHPVFSIPQPDGSTAVVDFTSPGSFGDLLIEVADGEAVEWFDAYHTAEALIFLTVYEQWAHRCSTSDILMDIGRVQKSLSDMTEALTPTKRSEHDFKAEIKRLGTLAVNDIAARAVSICSEDGRELAIKPETSGMWWAQETNRDGQLRLFVPNEMLHMFVIGLI